MPRSQGLIVHVDKSNSQFCIPYCSVHGGLMLWRNQWNLSIAYDLKLVKTHKIAFCADIFNVLAGEYIELQEFTNTKVLSNCRL